VHVSSSKAGVLGRLAAWALRVPVRVFTVHGWAFAADGARSALLYRWADRLVGPLTTATICVSELERSSGLAARTCVAERTVVIPNAVDVHGAPRARSTRSRPLLVAVGRLRPPKDFETLLRALALLPADAFDAAIVGDGPQRAELEALRTQLGLEDRVRLEGDRRDVPAVLADADAFVLSSRSEGLPVSVLEAMAAGLPVVASAVGGVGELVVDGETGMLVPPADAEALAAALATIVADPALRRRLGEAGHGRAEELFDLEAFRRAHVALYARELERAGRSVPAP
jgi:glycosyltransferase involved in cell wall biosynthesis